MAYTVQQFKLSLVRETSVPKEKRTITCRKDVSAFAHQVLVDQGLESVMIVALNGSNRIIGYQMTEGTTNQCALYPSNAMRFLLCAGAVSFIVAHNHPGGSTSPSEADWSITKKLQAAGQTMEIPLLDHIIITEDEDISMRDSARWN